MNKELLLQIESLKLHLVAFATGGDGNEGEYREMREILMAKPMLKTSLPDFIVVCRSLSEFWAFIKTKFATYSERREFLRAEFDPVLTLLERGIGAPGDEGISATVANVDSEFIRDAWTKALERRANDAEGAITAARTLLESVCKHVLDSSAEKYDDSVDLTKLYNLTAKQLNLSPSQHTEQLFKQVLGGCHTVIEGLGAMRNRHSDAHGKGMAGKKPAARHAELAVNLAGAMATFLLQTWESRLEASRTKREV